MKQKVTLKDVALALDFSISTVSKALRDSHEIGVETKKKVFEVADRLGYRAHPYAGHLHHQKSKTLAVIVPEMTNNFFVEIISGIQSVAIKNDYHVLIYSSDENYEQEVSILKHLENGRVDGVIMSISGTTKNCDHIKKLEEFDIPVVFFDRVCEEIETAKIFTDDLKSGFNATAHLIHNGCKNIAFLSVSDALTISNKRKQGYLSALKQYEFLDEVAVVVDCSFDNAENYRIIHSLLSSCDRPDGIFAAVENLALITYQVCRDLDLNIPKDCKIICFSNLRTASLLAPPLTTITQPAFEMGIKAATALFQYLKQNYRDLLTDSFMFESILHCRASSGCV